MSSNSFKKLKGIIFDLDGTLANTFLDFAQICIDADLPPGTKILEHCASLSNHAKAAEILSIVERHEMAGAFRAEWILDAELVLTRLFKAKIPMAIVTRNMRKATEITIERLSIPIDFVITREDCLPKPDPQGLLMVANSWGISPENLVYVGDYQFDLIAARNAGMKACLLANNRNQKFLPMADQVINKFAELELMLAVDF